MRIISRSCGGVEPQNDKVVAAMDIKCGAEPGKALDVGYKNERGSALAMREWRGLS